MKKFKYFFIALILLINIRYSAYASVGIWESIESIPTEPIYPTIQYVEVEPEQPLTREVNIPNHNGMKSWMPYNSFSKSSNQYELQQYAETDADGFRCINGRYLVAVGTAANVDVGQYVDIVLENGEIVPTIIADIKADFDTNSDNLTTTANGCVCEFLVDKSNLNKDVKFQGDVSAYDGTWNSPIIKFIVYEKINILGENYENQIQ